MKFTQSKLANGLTILGEYSPDAVSTAIGFFVKTGARDETPEVSGVSHFLEHMLFKGTPRRSALDITYQFSAIGAQSNAFTSEENTVYYTTVLPEYFADGFDILADMMRPSLDAGEFATEKGVILEEIALYKDIPSRVLFEAALQEFFTGHTAGNSVLGSTESITALSVEQMREYFNRRYSPSNIVLTVSGKFDWEEVTALAAKLCGGWENINVGRDRPVHRPQTNDKTLTKEDLQGAHLCLIGKGPANTDELRFAAQVLACILGDGSGSRTFWRLIDKGLADGASIDIEEMDGCGLVYAYASCAPEQLPEVESIMREIFQSASSVTDEEFERAITKLTTRLVLQGESSRRRLMSVGLDWLARGEYMPLEEELLKIRSVKKSDFARVLEQYSFQPTTTVRMLPA